MMTDRLARYDHKGLGVVLREAVDRDGRSLARIAADVGVTTTDLSKATSGITVGPAKVMALCDWAGVDVKHFYLPPTKSTRCGPDHVKQKGC